MARRRRSFLSRLLRRIFSRGNVKIGIYGPPNSGKTTLANRILRDWADGEVIGPESEVPHETRRVRQRENVSMKNNGLSLNFDIVDTPGIATKVDFHKFVEDYGMDEETGKRRAKEATEGVIESIKWLDDVEAVLLIMDSAQDPFTQINVTILGNLEARSLPLIIVANKIDLPESSPARLRAAFPQHPVVPISALTGYNVDRLYTSMAKNFR
jgi:hypothetical protein